MSYKMNIVLISMLTIALGGCNSALQKDASHPILNSSVSTSASQVLYNSKNVKQISSIPVVSENAKLWCSDDVTCIITDEKMKWETTDKGSHWNVISATMPSDKAELGELRFSSLSSIVWYADGYYKSDDGGKTWIKGKATPIDYPKGMLYSMNFEQGSKKGWVAGGMFKPISKSRQGAVPTYFYSPNGESVLEVAIFFTEDGGDTWTEQSLPSDVGRIDDLQFIDEAYGIATNGNNIYYTKNRGENWHRALFSPACVDRDYLENFYDSQLLSCTMIDSKHAWIVYNDGRMIKSVDGGKTWCDALNPGDVQFKDSMKGFFVEFSFLDSLRGVSLGSDKRLYLSKDGGEMWSQIDVNLDVISVSFPNTHRGLFITRNQMFEISLDLLR